MKYLIKVKIINLLIMLYPLAIGWAVDVYEGQSIQEAFNNATAGETIIVHEGVYRERISLNTHSKTGISESSPIIIRAAEDERPVLSGGMPVTGWIRCSSQEDALGNPNWQNIYKASVPKEEPVLLENKTYAYLCSDIDHELSVYACVDYFHPIDLTLNAGQTNYLIDNDRQEPDGYWDGAIIRIWLHLNNNNTSDAQIARFERDVNGHQRFTFDEALPANIGAGSKPDAYSIFNHPSLITRAGEYYYTPADNQGNTTIYFWPLDISNLADHIEYVDKGVAFSLTHNPNYKRSAGYVHIQGFEIYGYGSAGFRGQVHSSVPPLDSYISISDCIIHDTGSGVYMPRFNYLTIDRCMIFNCSVFGIYVAGTNNAVDRCDIRNTYHTNIYANGSNITRISGNYLTYTSRPTHGNGIAIYGSCRNMLIANNHIEHPSSSITMHRPHNVVFLNNLLTGSFSEWSGETTGSVFLLNNTFIGERYVLLGQTGHIVYVNNISPRFGLDQADVAQSNIVDISQGDFDGLFIDADNNDFRRNPNGGFELEGSSIDAYLTNIKTYFPNYDYDKDIAGNPRSETLSIGAFAYGAILFDPDVGTGAALPPEGKYTLSVNKIGNGTVIKTPDKFLYDENDTVSIRAYPDEGFIFESWSGDAAGSQNPTTVTMDSNKSITAQFNREFNPLAEEITETKLHVYNNILKSGQANKLTIWVDVKETSHVSVILYDNKGKKIKTLINEEKEQGRYPVVWDGSDESGKIVGSGIYIVHMEAGGYKETRKIAVIK